MTPEEKTQVLGTIEKLMNQIAAHYFSGRPEDVNAENVKTFLGRELAYEYPEIVWHWDSYRIIATDFIQKEI
jgi:hypothetical protein